MTKKTHSHEIPELFIEHNCSTELIFMVAISAGWFLLGLIAGYLAFAC